MSGVYTLTHLHSDYSLLDSTTKFEDYIKLAVENGMTAIASTEHGKPQGWISKKLMCDQAGIKFIHGVEVYLTENLEPKVRDNYHTVLLARNQEGIYELNKLLTRSFDEDHFYYTNRVSFDEFLSISDNIISTSACLASPLWQLPEDHPRYMELARKYDYLEVQPHICDDQANYNRRLLKLAGELDKPIVVGTDTHSSTPYKAECRALLMARKKQSYGNEDAFDLTFKTYDELVEMFRRQGVLPDEQIFTALENTNVIAARCDPIELDMSIKYPILYGSKKADEERFFALVEQKFREKCEQGVIFPNQIDAFRSAIDEELRVFKKLDMCGFMLGMSEILTWCRAQGMAIGTARGSVGGSRVAYVADIIDMNPETWHTVFSRFCNESRTEIGDIDTDVVESDRPAIFKYIINRFGKKHTGRVSSFGTIAELKFIDEAGGGLRNIWEKKHPGAPASENPWSIPNIKKIKTEYNTNPEVAKKRYGELFYYMPGMLGTRDSQSVHPAGLIISPIDLEAAYGKFEKDGESCIFGDMDEMHEVGAAKYDFLVLKTVQVIRDTCRNIGIPYPRSHEIDWNDQKVWVDMLRSPYGIFQMESPFASDSLKKFKPTNIFEMSLVTACIRPSGASYRDQMLARRTHSNPSQIIDELLKDNIGYLIYQEDVIAFLQQVCGLSGSEADTVRRGIAKKKMEILQESMPKILDGYCSRSDKPREVAESECNEFIKIIEDASSYMFGYNHSIAYCLLGYLCAYYRYYYPLEFITAFLDDAANDDDIKNGTALAKLYGIKVTTPKFGLSSSTYTLNKEENVIAKGVASIKGIGEKAAVGLYDMCRQHGQYHHFCDAVLDMRSVAHVDAGQIETLNGIDFFSMFGNQREILTILDMVSFFKFGEAKSVKKELVHGSPFELSIASHSDGLTSKGVEAKSYKLLDTPQIMRECEDVILQRHMPDLDIITKVKHFADAMGYSGYVSGKDEDRRKLYIRDVFPVKRKRDGKQFGYNILTQSIGSGIESRFTVFNRLYEKDPIQKGDVIYCTSYEKDGIYFTLTGYRHIRDDTFDEM